MLRRLLAVLVMPVVALVALIPAPKSWFYQNRRPTRLGRVVNRAWSWMAGGGLTPGTWPGEPRIGTIALETKGRRSGVARTTVVGYLEILADTHLAWQLPAFEGRLRVKERRHPKLYWVDPGVMRAAKGELHPPGEAERGSLLEGWVATRQHFGLSPDADIEEFERIAARHPVFRVEE